MANSITRCSNPWKTLVLPSPGREQLSWAISHPLLIRRGSKESDYLRFLAFCRSWRLHFSELSSVDQNPPACPCFVPVYQGRGWFIRCLLEPRYIASLAFSGSTKPVTLPKKTMTFVFNKTGNHLIHFSALANSLPDPFFQQFSRNPKQPPTFDPLNCITEVRADFSCQSSAAVWSLSVLSHSRTHNTMV